MVWRRWRGRSAVRREESAGGISESRRAVKISARLAVCRVDFSRRMVARYAQAAGPRVLPPRRISVTVVEVVRARRCGRMSSSESSFREALESVNIAIGLGAESAMIDVVRRERECFTQKVYKSVGEGGLFWIGFVETNLGSPMYPSGLLCTSPLKRHLEHLCS